MAYVLCPANPSRSSTAFAKDCPQAEEVATLLPCFTPIFLALGTHMLSGAARHLQLPCAGDGVDYRKWTEGCLLVTKNAV